MKRIAKQAVGIDVAKDELVVCLGRIDEDLDPELYAYQSFTNSSKGFGSLVAWVKKHTDPTAPVRYLMEATGVYHESLSYYLDENQEEVSIVLPNKIKNYARTLDTKTVTDKTASEAIARFGLSTKLDLWHRPKALYKKLRQLTRERGQLVEERTALKNQLHAEQSEAEPCKESMDRTRKRIVLLNKQIEEIMDSVKTLIKTDKETTEVVRLLCSVSGVGLLTAVIVISETNCFDLIRGKRQITSYAGLDVREKISGTSVKGKSRISKRGNKYLRKAMHFPALTAIRTEPRYAAIYKRLVSKHGIKMKAVVAVQRKLLELMFTVYKTKTKYDRNILQQNEVLGTFKQALLNQTKTLRDTQVIECPPKQAGKSRLRDDAKI